MKFLKTARGILKFQNINGQNCSNKFLRCVVHTTDPHIRNPEAKCLDWNITSQKHLRCLLDGKGRET